MTGYFAVCDCTGHGVPGAFINICTNALNRAVREFGLQEPGKILDKVSDLIVSSISQDGVVTDGMDACFVPSIRKHVNSFGQERIFLYLLRAVASCMSCWNLNLTNEESDTLKSECLTQLIKSIFRKMISCICPAMDADQFGGGDGKKLTRKNLRN